MRGETHEVKGGVCLGQWVEEECMGDDVERQSVEEHVISVVQERREMM